MQEGGLNLAKVCVILAGKHKHLTKDGVSCFMALLQIFCNAWAQLKHVRFMGTGVL